MLVDIEQYELMKKHLREECVENGEQVYIVLNPESIPCQDKDELRSMDELNVLTKGQHLISNHEELF